MRLTSVWRLLYASTQATSSHDTESSNEAATSHAARRLLTPKVLVLCIHVSLTFHNMRVKKDE